MTPNGDIQADNPRQLFRVVIASRDLTMPVLIVAGLALSFFVWHIAGFRYPFPQSISSQFDMVGAINAGEDWLKENLRWFTRGLASYVTDFIGAVEEFLWFAPWTLVVAAIGLWSLRYGGLRFALFGVAAVMFWGIMGQWDPTMSTLALMGVSVIFSIAIGVPLGIWCSLNDRVEAIVRPVLDTMQTMPAFVYLLPSIFFFGIGETGAAMAIIIYAMPPVVRLTNLGLRQVPATSVEVADSFGATRFQRLITVEIPQAMPSIILGINQTIMMALGLAVLAVFIGVGGLGKEVYQALSKLRVGWAFEAGMCIVIMAILFDRLTLAMSRPRVLQTGHRPPFRLLPQALQRFGFAQAIEQGIDSVWRGAANIALVVTDGAARVIGMIFGQVAAEALRRAQFLFVSLIILGAILLWNGYIREIGFFPSDWEISIRAPVDHAVDWLAVNSHFAAFSKSLRALIFLYLLNPLDQFLVGLPWFYVLAAFFVVGWASAGLRFGMVMSALLFFTGLSGMWAPTMETLAATITAVAICVLIGLPLGIIAAYSKMIDSVVRPILDTMQTMPAFVYLIPVLMLFGGNKVTAIIATVVYAVPPVVRMTILGLRQLPTEVSEVCASFGASEVQSLVKVKLPMASPSIMLGINQAIVMALAMQVITPMVAGEGLGKVVFSAMTLADTGEGLIAGTGIVLLAIILDRLTQSWSRRQRAALGV